MKTDATPLILKIGASFTKSADDLLLLGIPAIIVSEALLHAATAALLAIGDERSAAARLEELLANIRAGGSAH